MKKNLLALALAAAGCLSAGAYAADGASGTITFHGIVNGGTCTAPTDFANAKVLLGDVGVNEVNGTAQQNIRPWSKDFAFTACPAELTKIKTTVTFTNVGVYGYVKNSGTSNFAISLGHDNVLPTTTGYGMASGSNWDTNIANGTATVNIKGALNNYGAVAPTVGTLDFPINMTVEYI
ncbi:MULTISPECIES: fimbrial protein [unclassified Serratia (in: enterobacteria)]|uniref:fimbrial protein n=1 Tax=unclassified Serratia (in: enterobacteria) TaxID=2647522 RepID=UPI003B42F4C5